MDQIALSVRTQKTFDINKAHNFFMPAHEQGGEKKHVQQDLCLSGLMELSIISKASFISKLLDISQTLGNII